MTPNDYIIAIDPTVWQEDPEQPAYNPQPSNSTLIADYDNGVPKQAYLASPFTFSLSDWPAGAYIVGGWSGDTGLQLGQDWDDSEPTVVVGTPTYPLHADYYLIRPLGNKDGRATGKLVTPLFQGHSWDKYVEDDSWYPATDAPFTLKITRVEHVAPDPFPGFGWVVEMLSDDPERDITARAVGIYTDPECTAYEYTTGAFIQDGSHDNHYYTECPVGQRQPTNAQVNFALLLGSVQEGFFNLPEGGDDTEALFWSKDQGGGGVPEWSGAAVSYSIDDLVMYNSVEYVCIQAHTSQPAWTPTAVASLWSPV